MDRKLSKPDIDESVKLNDIPPVRTGGGQDNRGHRPAPGSGVVAGSGASAGGGGNPEDFDDDPVSGGGRHLGSRALQDVDPDGQAPLKRDENPLADLSEAPNDADDRSDAGRPTTDHDPQGWRAQPASKP